MLRARTGFDSVLLGDGSVLAVGDDSACLPGPAEPGSETAERYDPATDTWTVAASLNKPRKSFAMVRLADGRALVVGGTNPDDALYSSTKVFDPSTGEWTDGPLLDVARGDPAAATLADGRVLVGSVTFIGETTSTTTTEILDPDADAWIVGPPIEGLSALSFTALTDGQLMAVAEGFELDGAIVLFDSPTSTWQAVNGPSFLRQVRVVPLEGRNALAFGYEDLAIGRSVSASVERFDGATGRWSEVAPLSIPRESAIITRLADGRILVAGGATSEEIDPEAQALASTEIFDPVSETWSAGPDLLEPRKDGHALVLEDGSILIHGGDASFNVAGDVPWCPDPMTSTERVYLGS
jgi:Galactose oxidase, central domain/Kelch motif